MTQKEYLYSGTMILFTFYQISGISQKRDRE